METILPAAEVPQLFADVRRVAEITGLSTSHLNKLRLTDPAASPPHFRVGRRVLYPIHGPEGLIAWASRRAQEAQS